MSAKRAVLPGKDLLFNQRAPEPEPAAEPAPGPVALEVVALEPAAAPAGVAPGPAAVAPAPEVADTARHVQLCVWVDPAVAHEVDRARARLLMDYGVKVTKSQIVEALLRPRLTDVEALVQLLNE